MVGSTERARPGGIFKSYDEMNAEQQAAYTLGRQSMSKDFGSLRAALVQAEERIKELEAANQDLRIRLLPYAVSPEKNQ